MPSTISCPWPSAGEDLRERPWINVAVRCRALAGRRLLSLAAIKQPEREEPRTHCRWLLIFGMIDEAAFTPSAARVRS
jgi:hypothetical protein